MVRLFSRALILCAMFAFIGSCDSETHVSCDAVCGRYQTCFDDGYDVEACTRDCEDDADRDPKFDEKIADCHRCIEGRSCAGGAFACLSECVGIVP